jgi:very-short-patch-repair endonuclease
VERRNDPAIEFYFSEAQLEPLFVKNLESVQGDERDVMYFSITYGPDIAGRLSMNFGPMNRDGGERRLNVAITRARRELRVFSSMRPEQIDLSRTKSTGVSELKHFLEFAERGPRAFAELVTGSTGDFESPFEEYVASALQSCDWTIHTQVGASAFRIDLAVVHPDAPGIYLAGIECDGATYHRSATARDRDKLRQQILRDLGWEILRVWSTDWWIDRQSTLDKLDKQMRLILEKSRERRSVVLEPTLVITDPNEEDLAEEGRDQIAVTANGEYRHNEAHFSSAVAPEPDADTEQFFNRSYDSELSKMIAAIVEDEGPILAEGLARRIARIHGWHRTGARIIERVTIMASKTFKRTAEDGVGTFFWPRTLEKGQLLPFRPGLDRSVDEICLPELVSVALDVLATGKTGDEAVLAMAKAVGLQRLRASSRPRLVAALARAKRRLAT